MASLTTDVIACRLPIHEAEAFRAFARERDLSVSAAIRLLAAHAVRPDRDDRTRRG